MMILPTESNSYVGIYTCCSNKTGKKKTSGRYEEALIAVDYGRVGEANKSSWNQHLSSVLILKQNI